MAEDSLIEKLEAEILTASRGGQLGDYIPAEKAINIVRQLEADHLQSGSAKLPMTDGNVDNKRNGQNDLVEKIETRMKGRGFDVITREIVGIVRQHQAEQPPNIVSGDELVERVALAISHVQVSSATMRTQEAIAIAKAAIKAMGDGPATGNGKPREDALGSSSPASDGSCGYSVMGACSSVVEDGSKENTGSNYPSASSQVPDGRRFDSGHTPANLASGEIRVADDEKIKTAIFNTITRAECGLRPSERLHLMGIIYLEIKPYLRTTEPVINDEGLRQQIEVAVALGRAGKVNTTDAVIPNNNTIIHEIEIILKQIRPLYPNYSEWAWAIEIFKIILPYLRSPEPVSVSLEKCAKGIFNEYYPKGYGHAETYEQADDSHKANLRRNAKAVLNAAGVMYAD